MTDAGACVNECSGRRILQNEATHLHIFYDAHGRPSMVRWNGTDYAYLHNLQGDVVGLMDMQGTRVLEYANAF